MDAAAELGRIPQVSTRFSLSMEMSRLTRDGAAEPVSRDQILRRERRQGNIHFPCLADHEQDWQPYPVDPYIYIYVMTIHTYICILSPMGGVAYSEYSVWRVPCTFPFPMVRFYLVTTGWILPSAYYARIQSINQS